MLSKLLSRQLINHGLRLTTRAASTQQKVVIQRKPEVKHQKLFINNEFVDAANGSSFEVINPATGDVIAEVADASEKDVDRAVQAAKQAFRLGSEWRRMDPAARGALLYKLADLIERDQAYIAALETFNNGKPFKDSYYIDIPHAISVLR
jgi:aldehyde dehydrogenase (NAD+)